MILKPTLDFLFSKEDYKAIHLVVSKHAQDPPMFSACLVGGGNTTELVSINPLPEDFDQASKAITKVVVELHTKYKSTGLDFVTCSFVSGVEEDLIMDEADICHDLLEEAMETIEPKERKSTWTIGESMEPSAEAMKIESPKGPYLN